MLPSIIRFWWCNFIWIGKRKQLWSYVVQSKIKLLGRQELIKIKPDSVGDNDEKERCLLGCSL